MKLFIWNDVEDINYGGSCLYVIAETEEQAREAAMTARVSKYGHQPRERVAVFNKLPAPSRVIEGPYAELYWWQE